MTMELDAQIPDSVKLGTVVPVATSPTETQDSLPRKSTGEVVINDALDDEVDYGSVDTAWLDVDNRKLHLIGDAYARYQGRELKADYIIIDLESNLAEAQGLPDSTGEISGRPIFNDNGKEFTSDKISFNFKTEKGKIRDIRTREKDIYILGEDTKYISKTDSSEENGDVVFIKNGEFTTCDHDEPHYALKSNKIKTVLNNVAVTGATNVQISRVPTPVWLPFAFFPLTEGKSAGLIFPRDYEYSEELGFGLRNVGYYVPISDRMDLTVVGDIYFSGTYGLRATTRYKRRYKHNGTLTLSWRSQEQEFLNQDDQILDSRRINSFGVNWSHNQDAKAHPTRSFSGSVNFQTNNNARRTFNDAINRANNTVRSNINFTQRFPDKPYTLTASLNHSQNNNTREVIINFPNIDFRMQRIYPLKRKKRIGKEKWYERLSLQYSANAKNRISAPDSTLFSDSTLMNMRFGMQHKANSQLNLKILKYFTFSPSVDYSETYFSHTRNQQFIDQLEIEEMRDTLDNGEVLVSFDTTFGRIEEMIDPGLSSFRDLSVGAGINTQIFNTLEFQKGWLRGIRHSMRPTVSFNYRPDQTLEMRDYIRRVRTDTRPEFADTLSYNKFRLSNQVYNVTPGEKQLSIGYGLSNNIEAKYFSKKDSSFKKLKLINNLNFSGSHNFARDSLRFSALTGSGSTTIFQGVTVINYNANWDFYALNDEGQRVNKLYVQETGKPLRFTGAQIRVRNSINARNLKKIFKSDKKQKSKSDQAARQGRSEAQDQDDLLSLLSGLSLEHNITVQWLAQADSVERSVSNNIISLRINRVQLSPNWNVRIGNIGYNFVTKRATFPDFGVYRDLHCWEAGIDVQPRLRTFNFFIRVKPSSFSFLNLPYRRNNVDGPLNF